MNEQAEKFFVTTKKWSKEFNLLRKIIRENKLLKEDYKWMHPCYTFREKNIVLIHGFKEYCAILFYKGALVKDTHNILIQQTENVQSARQIRFTGIEQIKKQKSIIKEYIKEAVEIEKMGKTIEKKTVADYPVPIEFQKVLQEDTTFKKSFYSLTPGRQKAYLFYFNQAKQAKTRESRIEKFYQNILDGKGLDD